MGSTTPTAIESRRKIQLNDTLSIILIETRKPDNNSRPTTTGLGGKVIPQHRTLNITRSIALKTEECGSKLDEYECSILCDIIRKWIGVESREQFFAIGPHV